MSARLGNPVQITVTAAALSTSPTASTPTNLAGWSILVSVVAIYVAQAGGGVRQPVLTIKDSAGNILWQNAGPTTIAGGATSTLVAGSSVSNLAITGPPLTQLLTIPVDFPFPPGGTIAVTDGNAVNGADTVSYAAIISY